MPINGIDKIVYGVEDLPTSVRFENRAQPMHQRQGQDPAQHADEQGHAAWAAVRAARVQEEAMLRAKQGRLTLAEEEARRSDMRASAMTNAMRMQQLQAEAAEAA